MTSTDRIQDTRHPKLALVFGQFSFLAQMTQWQGLEALLNPCNMFEEIHVLALGDDREYPVYEFGRIRVHRFRSPVSLKILKRLNDLVLLLFGSLYLWWLVRKFEIDLIAQHDSSPLKYGIPAVFAGQRTKTPSLITLNSDYARVAEFTLSSFSRGVSRLLWPYVFRGCTKVRAVSRTVAQFALDYGVPREKVVVIPNKEQLALFRDPWPKETLDATATDLDIQELVSESVVFLSVARLIEIKNLDRCLRAFAFALKRVPNMSYLIVGKGPLIEELQGLSQSLGISDRVRFLGYFPHKRLGQVYQLSSVFLFPTLYEGHPRALMEAMAARLAIICSNYGAVTEMVGPEDGLLVDPTSERQIADAIQRLAADEELRNRMSVHPSFDPVKFSVEAVGRVEAKVYNSMLPRAFGVGRPCEAKTA